MKTSTPRRWPLVVFGGLISLGLITAVAATFVYVRAMGIRHAHWQVPAAEIDVPWPLDDDEVLRIRETYQATGQPLGEGQLEEAASRAAAERGRGLARTRLGCVDCHGHDLGGRIVTDHLLVGGMVGANLTLGLGGRPDDYDIVDFERQVRHGVDPEGRPSLMPSVDFAALSDREVSDLWVWVISHDPVDRELPASYLGPLQMIQLALGTAHLPASLIDHTWKRPRVPPTDRSLTEYGAHLTTVCRGCHGADYAGGPIEGGDPTWPQAANLTPHADGLKDWSELDFLRSMREGVRPDGSAIDPVMPWTAMAEMDDLELRAIHAYLQTLAPTPTGGS